LDYIFLEQSDLDARWIDWDEEGIIYNHFGFVIKGATEFNDDGVFFFN
jgi:hypothetical protein